MKRVLEQPRFFARGQGDRPHVTGVVLAEHVPRLEPALRLAPAHQDERLAVGRPGRLDVVERAARDLALLPRNELLDEDLADPSHLAGERDARAVRGERGQGLDLLLQVLWKVA